MFNQTVEIWSQQTFPHWKRPRKVPRSTDIIYRYTPGSHKGIFPVTLKTSLGGVISDINHIIKIGKIEVDGKEVKIEIFWGGGGTIFAYDNGPQRGNLWLCLCVVQDSQDSKVGHDQRPGLLQLRGIKEDLTGNQIFSWFEKVLLHPSPPV